MSITTIPAPVQTVQTTGTAKTEDFDTREALEHLSELFEVNNLYLENIWGEKLTKEEVEE